MFLAFCQGCFPINYEALKSLILGLLLDPGKGNPLDGLKEIEGRRISHSRYEIGDDQQSLI